MVRLNAMKLILKFTENIKIATMKIIYADIKDNINLLKNPENKNPNELSGVTANLFRMLFFLYSDIISIAENIALDIIDSAIMPGIK